MRRSAAISWRCVISVLRKRLEPGTKTIRRSIIATWRGKRASSKSRSAVEQYSSSSFNDVTVQHIARQSRVFRLLNSIFEASGSGFVLIMGAYIWIMYSWIKASEVMSFHIDPLIPGIKTGSDSSAWIYPALVLATPILGFFFVWQPHLIKSTFALLEENGVIGDARNDHLEALPAVVQSMATQLHREQETSIGMDGAFWEIGILVVFVVSLALSPIPLLNAAPILFITPPAFYFSVQITSLHTTFVGWIEELFSSFYPRPQLFHYDGANGFAAIGDYILWSTVFMSFSTSILFSYMFQALVLDPRESPAYVGIAVMTLIVVPISLYHSWLRPILNIHRLMTSFRQQTLAKIDSQLSESVISNAETETSMLSDMLKRRELVVENLKSWPIRRGAFKIASTVIGSATLGTLLSWTFAHTATVGSMKDTIFALLDLK